MPSQKAHRKEYGRHLASGGRELMSKDILEAINPRIGIVGFHKAPPGLTRNRIVRPACIFEFWYVRAGQGRVQIDDQTIRLYPGVLLSIMPNQAIRNVSADRLDPWTIQFFHALLTNDNDHATRDRLSKIWPQQLLMPRDLDIGVLLDRMLELHVNGGVLTPLKLKQAFLELLERMSLVLGGGANDQRPLPSKISRACDFISHNLDRPITLHEIAIAAGLSPSRTNVLFRKHFGRSPIQYLIDQRITQSRLMLMRGESVTRVAQETGFNSIHHFSRMFTKRTGVTPTLFAKRAVLLPE